MWLLSRLVRESKTLKRVRKKKEKEVRVMKKEDKRSEEMRCVKEIKGVARLYIGMVLMGIGVYTALFGIRIIKQGGIVSFDFCDGIFFVLIGISIVLAVSAFKQELKKCGRIRSEEMSGRR